MNGLAETIATIIRIVWDSSVWQRVVRGGGLGLTVVTVVLLSTWTQHTWAGVLPATALVLAGTVVVWPESPAAGVLVGMLALWWVLGGSGALGSIVVAALLGLIHLAATEAAAGPSHAVRQGSGRVVARGVAFTAATVAAAVLVALVVNAGIGTTWVSLLAASVAVLAGAVLALRLASW